MEDGIRATFVIVLNWHGEADTIEAVRSCRQSEPESKVLIVDNESTVESRWRLSVPFAEDGHVNVLPLEHNYGFGAAHNAAFAWIMKSHSPGTQFVYLLNSDACLAPGALREAINTLSDDPKSGAVGSVLLDAAEGAGYGQLVQSAGGRFSPLFGTTRQYRAFSSDNRIDYITFAAVALRLSAVIAVGGFDERFFMYWEDAELCRRLKASGWNLCICESSAAVHFGGKSGKRAGSSTVLSYYIWSSLLFRDEAGGIWRLTIPLKALYMFIRGVVTGNSEERRGVLAGFRRYRNRTGSSAYLEL